MEELEEGEEYRRNNRRDLESHVAIPDIMMTSLRRLL